MSGRRGFWIFLAVLVAAVFALLFHRMEWVEEELDAGYGSEARRNDFLAARAFPGVAGRRK